MSNTVASVSTVQCPVCDGKAQYTQHTPEDDHELVYYYVVECMNCDHAERHAIRHRID